MNKLSALVLVATIGFTAPTFAQTLSQSRSFPFLASDTSQTPVVTNNGIGGVKSMDMESEKPAAPMKKTSTVQKSGKKHAHKAAHAKTPAKKKTTKKTTVKKTTSTTTDSK